MLIYMNTKQVLLLAFIFDYIALFSKTRKPRLLTPTMAIPEGSCPLCMLDDVDVEHASNASACNVYIRKIMARELVFYGTCESKVVSPRLRTSTTSMRDEMVKSGLECTEWTTEMVQRHFEHHTKLVPRHVIWQRH